MMIFVVCEGGLVRGNVVCFMELVDLVGFWYSVGGVVVGFVVFVIR